MAARDLIQALLHPAPASPFTHLNDSQHAALHHLADIFSTAASPVLAAPVDLPLTHFKCVAVAEQWVLHGRPKGLHGLRYNAHVCADPEGDESISIGCEQLIVPDAKQNLSFLTISFDKQLLSLALDRTIVGRNDEI